MPTLGTSSTSEGGAPLSTAPLVLEFDDLVQVPIREAHCHCGVLRPAPCRGSTDRLIDCSPPRIVPLNFQVSKMGMLKASLVGVSCGRRNPRLSCYERIRQSRGSIRLRIRMGRRLAGRNIREGPVSALWLPQYGSTAMSQSKRTVESSVTTVVQSVSIRIECSTIVHSRGQQDSICTNS